MIQMYLEKRAFFLPAACRKFVKTMPLGHDEFQVKSGFKAISSKCGKE